jgi:hypothetical protein
MTSESPHNGSTRLEREILEILERTDSSATTPVDELQAAVKRRSASARGRVRQVSKPEISPEILRIGGALLLAVGAAAVSDLSRLLATILAIASLVLFLSLWVPTRPSSAGGPPRWRGQELRDPAHPPSFDIDRLRTWRPRWPNK